ncbi:extracellular solute-binding protein [Lichenihabitans sp. Uapishka_5]|uniref:extracellular solute-binding protein n=1 Tax=Lichenihabitans sp. Uapishka_5 TaxID=3037302 RepID=UPI0029E7E0B6|nr:extracellular solute-binding protein [Lichenihabitans sp. Uapishka_5]MDX7953243.1 extracellular solute-binding protein [Lichenihabitans sp. Uapishka_5]
MSTFPASTPVHLSRRDLLAGTGAISLATVLGVSPLALRTALAADGAAWSLPPDLEAAKAEGAQFQSYGMPDSWANYGEVIAKLGQRYGFAATHTDTDMNSLEEITKFEAEKNNAVAICADIGILYGKVADQKAVVPPYMPPNAAKLPAGLKGDKGGWVATFTGVPAMVVNTDVIKTVPKSWADLAKPEYKGKIETIDAAGGAGTTVSTFIAWAYAFGGSENDLKPAIDFAKTMVGQYASAPANTQTLEKGEVPIQIKYDFNCIAAVKALKAKGVNAAVVIPADGSIYAPSALMLNTFNTAKMNVAKLMLDFVLSDEGQAAFAKFGARPIRWVLGDLKLPDDAKANWLPDAAYAKVHSIPDWSKVDLQKVVATYRDEVSG